MLSTTRPEPEAAAHRPPASPRPPQVTTCYLAGRSADSRSSNKLLLGGFVRAVPSGDCLREEGRSPRLPRLGPAAPALQEDQSVAVNRLEIRRPRSEVAGVD